MKASQTFFRKGTIWNLRLSSRADNGSSSSSKTRIAENCPADGHPLFLATGEMFYTAIEQTADFQDFHDGVESYLAVIGHTPPVTVQEVAFYAQVREETRALEDHAHTPVFCAHVYAGAAVEEGFAVEHDDAFVGPGQSGDETDQGRFTAARRAEDTDSLSLNRKVRVEKKVTEALLYHNLEFQT